MHRGREMMFPMKVQAPQGRGQGRQLQAWEELLLQVCAEWMVQGLELERGERLV